MDEEGNWRRRKSKESKKSGIKRADRGGTRF